jgi:methionyl-tRNA synthetase
MAKWIVCAAWPYLDGKPHLGTFMHLLSADVYSRYLRLMGNEVVSVSGSDIHGTPIEVEALRSNTSPRELAEKYHRQMVTLLNAFLVQLDNYTTTESPVHIKFVRDFYTKLYENGFVYSKKVRQLYCERDAMFLPDRFVEGICPYCGKEGARGDQCDSCGRLLDPLDLRSPRCVICGLGPIVRESEHWFFDLPQLSVELEEYIRSNKEFPENARNFSLTWLKEGLKPRTLTRDNRWGIPSPFPGSEGKTIYVWMEAVLGYLSAVKEFGEKKGDEGIFERFWKDANTRSVYFIGKDNIPFHTIIFPALLMASKQNYVLPMQVSSTEFILLEGKKFSKSKGIGVWLEDALRVCDPEYWRFVLMYFRPESRDSNFSWPEFERCVNSEMNDVLGNFIHRVLTFVKRFFNTSVPDPGKLDEDSESLLALLEDAWASYVTHMDSFALKDAVRDILDIARSGNEYVSNREPWEKAKTDVQSAAQTVYVGVQLVYTICLMMYPFLPRSSIRLWQSLGLNNDLLTVGTGGAGKASIAPGHRILPPSPLFSKVKVDPSLGTQATHA